LQGASSGIDEVDNLTVSYWTSWTRKLGSDSRRKRQHSRRTGGLDGNLHLQI